MNSNPMSVVERLQQAQNAQDLDAFVACFAPDYQSDQPVHPERAFRGAEQVRKNWSAIFQDVPNFHGDLLGSSTDGDTAWTEWHWFGDRRDGTRFEMRGVIILGTQADQIKWARLYVETL